MDRKHFVKFAIYYVIGEMETDAERRTYSIQTSVN